MFWQLQWIVQAQLTELQEVSCEMLETACSLQWLGSHVEAVWEYRPPPFLLSKWFNKCDPRKEREIPGPLSSAFQHFTLPRLLFIPVTMQSGIFYVKDQAECSRKLSKVRPGDQGWAGKSCKDRSWATVAKQMGLCVLSSDANKCLFILDRTLITDQSNNSTNHPSYWWF